jgi:hypothetical protein
MSIYDVNFKQVGLQLLPPDKRNKRTVGYLLSLLNPLQWVRDLWFGDYRTGSIGLPWLSTTTYTAGERVTFKGSAYESLVLGNVNNNPTDVNYWLKIQRNFIGIEERLTYTGNLLIFTYAINKYFGSHFRQPNNVSDIYVSANVKPPSVFIIGYNETGSSKVYSYESSEFVIDAYNFADYFNMSIHVPLAVYNSLDTDPLNCEKIIRNFADRYIIAGVIYKIETY